MTYKIIEEVGRYSVVKYLCGRYGVISADGKTKSGMSKTFALARELAEVMTADKLYCGA